MRVLWATCGLAVAASALTGVLIGVVLDGMNDGPQADTPASTWITGRPSTSGSGSPIPTTTVPTTEAGPPAASPTAEVKTTTTTTTPPPPPPPPVTTEAPPVTTTTTETRNSEWPCSPLNLFPPPHCND
ncbi:type IV secretory pathway VirB10-like protein [Saccharothrix ecbatanensis]|uniref:Type IV secretory pathway VirB10-like protein n=1 Tax=Saccharothrix ecbatanensis TaxID=1105145 RepID=A0A7W9HN27_9PSEU|nr:hypothetical protein [Saccharothrix ecbatanensis]MBB5805041.1 type IV secretory pathway VirB10-like protein [Saccharothrix ecbatanensis]